SASGGSARSSAPLQPAASSCAAWTSSRRCRRYVATTRACRENSPSLPSSPTRNLRSLLTVRLSVATCLFSAALIAGACGRAGTRVTGICARDPVRLVALTDLAGGLYHRFQGGLYPDGRNSPPAGYLAQGRALARQVHPLCPDGLPSTPGVSSPIWARSSRFCGSGIQASG